MTEERQTDATAGASDGITGDAAISSGGQTVEEVEAFWRNRQSGTDRSHNAETAALRAQIEALKAQPNPAPSGEPPEAAKVRELEAALRVEQQRAAAAELRSAYPYAASVLGESIATLPVEKVAAVEALGELGQAPRIDPNAAARRPAGVPGSGQKSLKDMSKDELLAQLRRASPQIQAEAREGIIR